MWNLADAFGILFLGYGILDGYRKGFVKKGISLGASLLTLAAVYLVSPYVAQFIEGILPNAFSLESLAGSESDIYRMLYLSGFGEAAEEYVYSFVSRVLALVITYIVVRLLLKTVALSLELMVKVPGLSILNRLMGSAFGFLQQLLVLWMLFLVLAIFSHTGFGERLYELIRQSMWMGYLYEHNVLLLLGIIFILGI
ncbi:MAG: CvpA family protein [Lachnospiraceae bacterium]|nr:CvpA family protein [Lachnospiraceae bacterium]